MADENTPDHVWSLIEAIPMALLITKEGEALDARPMAAHAKSEEGRIYILANKREDSDRQVQEDPMVALGYQKDTVWVVVHGRAHASNDRAKIRELFSVFAKAWWHSAEDPRIRLLTIVPERAEYWESPGKLISYADMLLSAATGKRPQAGDHGHVAL